MSDRTPGRVHATLEVPCPEMVALPGGRFLMGSETGRSDERPVREVVVSAFEIGRYAVTNQQYAAFLRETRGPSPPEWNRPRFNHPRQPVCGVSWVDAVHYCEWLNDRFGGEGSSRFHLPTEAQRQYAASGGVGACAYPWGDETPPLTGCYARGLDGSQVGRPMVVGTVPWWPSSPPSAIGSAPGPFGLFNLADNVHEWCADYYQRDAYVSSGFIDPRGPTASDRRVASGGSWRHDLKFSRNTARSSLNPSKRFLDFGFRVACSEGFAYVYCDVDTARV